MIIIIITQVRTLIIFCATLAALAGTGCGSSGGGDATTIAATTGIAADLAENVAGEAVEVVQVIPDGASPHDFQLSAQDRQVLEEAELIVAIGSGLEPGIPLEEIDTPRWELTTNAGPLLAFVEAGAHDEREHAEQEPSEGDDQAGGDPHVWMDPSRVAGALPSLAAALAAADEAGAQGHEARAAAYAKELLRLDRELERTLEAIPAADRELVTSHDSLGYLAERYGFEVIATAFPASGPEAEPSAGRLKEVSDAVFEHGVEAVFAQQDDDPQVLRLIAEETGVEIEEGLVIESPGALADYPAMLRHDAELITAALAR